MSLYNEPTAPQVVEKERVWFFECPQCRIYFTQPVTYTSEKQKFCSQTCKERYEVKEKK